MTESTTVESQQVRPDGFLPGGTLRALIDSLKGVEDGETFQVSFRDGGFPGYFVSYRGFYYDLAISYCDIPITLPEFVNRCTLSVGNYSGWKGGNFRMGFHTSLWQAQDGECSRLAIVGATVDREIGMVWLETEKMRGSESHPCSQPRPLPIEVKIRGPWYGCEVGGCRQHRSFSPEDLIFYSRPNPAPHQEPAVPPGFYCSDCVGDLNLEDEPFGINLRDFLDSEGSRI